jgi:hypothetical protein
MPGQPEFQAGNGDRRPDGFEQRHRGIPRGGSAAGPPLRRMRTGYHAGYPPAVLLARRVDRASSGDQARDRIRLRRSPAVVRDQATPKRGETYVNRDLNLQLRLAATRYWPTFSEGVDRSGEWSVEPVSHRSRLRRTICDRPRGTAMDPGGRTLSEKCLLDRQIVAWIWFMLPRAFLRPPVSWQPQPSET